MVLLYQFAISISVLLLLKSSIHSLLAIRPFLTPSDKANIFSFVDITNTYRTSEEYERKINTVNKNEIIREMSSLNYALSKGLMKKYESQQKSVDSIIMSLVIMSLTLLFSFNTGC
ncbi:Pycsar system effector family protein [Proteus mirabilis]|uniref:Pycsar system effector family protein n=1 Tax=Proteus mirabilis TaxID=584 RepID=UPI003983AB04